MALPHELHVGADVYSGDGKKLGELHRLVLRRADLSVSHIVVDIGFLRSGQPIWEGGLGLDYDRVVPISQVASASDDRVVLSVLALDFKDAPEYSEDSFEPPRDLSPNEFDIPDVVNRTQGLAAMLGSTSGQWLFEKLNKSPDEVDIAEGTPVWRRDPHEKLGEVHRVITDEAGRLTAFVLDRGLLRRDVVLPVRYIAEIFDDLVRVDISDAELDQLRTYEA